MPTHLQGSFHTSVSFTVRTTVGVSSADWTVSAGTTYATADAALAAWNTVLTSISVSIARSTTASTHRASLSVDTGGPTFSITWSHLGDGSRMRDFLGEVGDLSAEADGYTFDNPLAVGLFPSYGLRRLDISAEPWERQRLMTGAGAITANNPHHGTAGALRYDAQAEMWIGHNVGTSYEWYEALAIFIDGLLEYGQPFVITTDDDAYTCRLQNSDTLELIPEPLEDIQRGDLYRVTLPVVVID